MSTVVATPVRRYPGAVVQRFSPVLSGIALAGCIALDEDPGRLEVVSSEPAPGRSHPAGEPLRVRFDRYLDPAADWTPAVSLRSADVDIGADVGYDPAGPDLVVVPRIALRPG